MASSRCAEGTNAASIVPSGDGRFAYTAVSNTVGVFGFTPTCPASARTDCREPIAPGGARLVLKQGPTDATDTLMWKWNKGEATSAEDLGDPTTSSHYAFCFYDASAAIQPLLAALAPAAGQCFGVHPNLSLPCWSASQAGLKRLLYNDRNTVTGLTPDGIGEIKLAEGTAGRASLRLKGRGAPLALPAMPLSPPVELQLLNLETNVCWRARFSAPATNLPQRFVARSD
jgi:hypothetical protein